jgi:hypothetical protein
VFHSQDEKQAPIEYRSRTDDRLILTQPGVSTKGKSVNASSVESGPYRILLISPGMVNTYSCVAQGFPILINRTATGKQQSKGLIEMSIEGAHLSRHIANAEPVHQAHDGAIELGEQPRNWSSAGLASIFP